VQQDTDLCTQNNMHIQLAIYRIYLGLHVSTEQNVLFSGDM